MEGYILDWANLLLRWLHVITAIAWVGSSFYFVFLDSSLTPPEDEDLKKQGVSGELWAVHGGGFYHPVKFNVSPPKLPDHLHWLMELQTGTLAECMSLLKSRSSRLLNQQLGRRGALWQHGYHDHAVRSDESLHEKAMYIMANPVRAGLACELGEYPYAWCRWPL